MGFVVTVVAVVGFVVTVVAVVGFVVTSVEADVVADVLVVVFSAEADEFVLWFCGSVILL